MKPLRTLDVADAQPVVVEDDLASVARGRRHRKPSTLAALAERDRLLCQAAMQVAAGMSQIGAATKLAPMLNLYRVTGWRRDAVAQECPTRHLGTVREFWWRILRVRDAPLSSETVRRALRKGAGKKITHADYS